MRKRTVFYCFFVGVFLVLSGCSQKEKDYSEVIDSALTTNQELIDQYDWNEKYRSYDRGSSNILIWEDEDNYFVYFRKNIENSYVVGDGYKISKNNFQGSSTPTDRAEIVSFLKSNDLPIYEEINIDLVSDDFAMR